MIKYILIRLFLIVITLYCIMTIVFFIGTMTMLYYWSYPRLTLQETVPITIEHYFEYIKGIYKEWYWGHTVATIPRSSAWDRVIVTVPVTIMINAIAFVFYVTIGIVLGIMTGIKKNSLIDKLINNVVFILNSIPSFTLLLIMILFIGIQAQLLPPRYVPFESGFKEWRLGLIMPLIALCVAPIAHIMILVRGEYRESQQSDYLLLARAKGLNKRQLFFRHGLRNSLAPVSPSLVSMFIIVLCNSFIIEEISKTNGMGALFLISIKKREQFGESVFQFDTYVVILIVLVISAMCLIFNLIMDLSYKLIDPRVRIGEKH